MSQNSLKDSDVIIGSKTSSGFDAGVTYDEGLRSFMLRIFNLMALGIAISAAAAYGFGTIPMLNALLMNGRSPTILGFVVMLAPLIMVFTVLRPNAVMNRSVAANQTLFYLFCAIMGASLSYIFKTFDIGSIFRAFFVTSGTFAGTALIGYTTKRDLSKLGSLMMMGLIGIIIAIVVIILTRSSVLALIIDIATVLVFTGMTAYEVQAFKETYASMRGHTSVMNMATIGALNLYMNFINLFMAILRLVGNRN